MTVDGHAYDPFDAEAINVALNPHGLVYGGGLGRLGKPHFFLANLERRQQMNGTLLLVAGRELARDLSAPPGMTQNSLVYVRRESLTGMLWEKLESWRWHRPDNPLGRAFACYDFENDLAGALQQMTDSELDLVLLHEQGERAVGELLGPAWNEALLELVGTPAEIAARAVRDHLADCHTTLPALLDLERPASLHFYVGNLGAMRKSLFPALVTAYERWFDNGDTASLRQLVTVGEVHWQRLAHEVIELVGAAREPLAIREHIQQAELD